MKLQVLDTTLRDGAQSEAVSFSIPDKIKIVRLLDELGIDLIEAGNPFSNVKDREFFREIANYPLKHAKLAAFGSTRRVGISAAEDAALEALLGNSTPLYARLYREGLINQEFSYGYECYPGCAFLMAGGESKDPEAVGMAVAGERDRIGREGIDPALWERVKKGVYGNKVRGLNSFENLCVGQAQAFFAGSDFLRFADLFDSITRQEAEELIESWVTGERTALSVVRAKEDTQ